MATVVDYENRTADLSAFQGVFPHLRGREQLLAHELVRTTDGGSLVTGVLKGVQRFLVILLTPRGSKLYRPSEGTFFMTEARLGAWRTPADVSTAFYAARLLAARQMREVELTTDPPDERYGVATLNGVTLVADKVSIRVDYESLAGTKVTVITPIQVPIK